MTRNDLDTTDSRVFKKLNQRNDGTCDTAKGFWRRLDKVVTIENVVGRDTVLRACGNEPSDVAGLLQTIFTVVDASYGPRIMLVYQPEKMQH